MTVVLMSLLNGLNSSGTTLGQCATVFAIITGTILVLVIKALLAVRPISSWVQDATRTAAGTICGMLYFSVWTQNMGKTAMVGRSTTMMANAGTGCRSMVPMEVKRSRMCGFKLLIVLRPF